MKRLLESHVGLVSEVPKSVKGLFAMEDVQRQPDSNRDTCSGLSAVIR